MNIVFDIGGTNMRIAAVHGDALGDVRKIATPQDPDDAIKNIVAFAKESGESIERIAGCSRGRIVDSVFVNDKLLPRWNGTPLGKKLTDMLGAPARVVNDMAAIGIGEVHRGAGKGSAVCAYVTVSSGVNGARIIDGTIDRGVYTPEIGRSLVNGVQLEDLVSGTAVQTKFGIHPKELESLDERNKLADILAVGLNNMVLHWTPDTIVLGGSMIIGVNPIPLERVETTLTEMVLQTYPSAPKVKMASLGDNGGLYGGMILASGGN